MSGDFEEYSDTFTYPDIPSFVGSTDNEMESKEEEFGPTNDMPPIGSRSISNCSTGLCNLHYNDNVSILVDEDEFTIDVVVAQWQADDSRRWLSCMCKECRLKRLSLLRGTVGIIGMSIAITLLGCGQFWQPLVYLFGVVLLITVVGIHLISRRTWKLTDNKVNCGVVPCSYAPFYIKQGWPLSTLPGQVAADQMALGQATLGH